MKKYRIAIDATRLSKTRTGIDYYTYYLIKTFFEQKNNFCRDFQFTIFVSREGNDLIKSVLGTTDQFSVIQVPFRHPLFRQQLGLLWANLVRKEPFDLFHSMGYPFPLFFPTHKKVITVHDIGFRIYPQFLTTVAKWHWNLQFRNTLRRSDLIFCDSNFTKSEILKNYPVSFKKLLTTIYLGISPIYVKPLENPKLDQHILVENNPLPDKYFLFVGSIHPRKNLSFLSDCLSVFWKKYPQYKYIKLLIVGEKGWKYQPVLNQISNLCLKDQIIFSGYIPEEKMPYLYHNSKIFFYPSLYEGFGLPPLEAMACGTPVIVSDRSSLPEIIGEAGISLPLEIDLWIEAIQKLIEDENNTKILIEKGKAHVKSFTWESCAQKVIDSYRSILGI